MLHSRIAMRFVILADNDHEVFSHDGPTPDQLVIYGDNDGRLVRVARFLAVRSCSKRVRPVVLPISANRPFDRLKWSPLRIIDSVAYSRCIHERCFESRETY